jgi:uncharacterized membrane protein
MILLFILGGAVAGLMLGAAAGRSLMALGFFAGIAIGVAFGKLYALSQEVASLRRELAEAQRKARPAPVPEDSVRSPAAPAAAPPPPATAPATPAEPRVPAAPAAWPMPTQPAVRNADAHPARVREPDLLDQILGVVKRWFTEGNVPVKVGVLVLFAGIGALLRYAQKQGWLRLPIGMRLTGLALAAVVALWFGWRERARRRAFGLTIQGGAIGILLMTVFGAFRLYHLLPATLAFALMLVLVGATCWLALTQDSIALAVLALLAGFAAPILSSTGEGSHVVLFSYYALFNLAIFAMAWRKSWRLLNLLGFAFTFLIGIAWGVLRYTPQQFVSGEVFLAVFFAIYVAIPIANGLRQAPQRREPVDGTLVFGNPLLTFALQTGLLEGARLPLAYSALALMLLYALLGWSLLTRVRVLGEAFVVLAVVFGTLSIPLALSAWATACAFALEGAALLWLGFRQQRRLQRWSGLALQILAAFAYLYSWVAGPSETVPVLNGSCMSAMLIAVAGFVAAWLYLRHERESPRALWLYFWALAWWIGGGVREIERFVPADLFAPSMLAFSALTALLAAVAWRRLAAVALAWTTAVLLALGVMHVFGFAAAGLLPWSPWPLAALAGYASAGFTALALLRAAPRGPLGIAHGGWLWTWTCALGLAAWRLSTRAQLGDGWQDALTFLPLVLAWASTQRQPHLVASPLGERFDEWRTGLGTSQALVAGALLLILLFMPGSSAPFPWLPLANPLEALQLSMLLVAAAWLGGTAPAACAQQRALLLSVGGFLFASSATLRGVHHLGALPWSPSLLSAALAQTSLTVVWSVLGVAGWVLGSRRGNRTLWLAGAVLMGVVLAKLLLIDRGHLGSVLGIVSFIAYGLLCTVIGYLAPAPPRTAISSQPQ